MINCALIIFTRVPIPGTTKTRLTLEKDGPLKADEAAKFYEASLMDTIVTSLNALQSCKEHKESHNYDLFIAYNPKDRKESIIELLEKLFLKSEASNRIRLFAPEGKNFNDRIYMGFDTIFKDGYEVAIAIGGDAPTLQPRVIIEAFSLLEQLDKKFAKGAMVVGPCLEAGTYLVGQTNTVHIDFDGVFYNPQGITALEAFTEKAIARGIPLAILELIPDVDIPSDLASMIVYLKTMEYSARFQPNLSIPHHTLKVISNLHIVARAPPSQRDLELQ